LVLRHKFGTHNTPPKVTQDCIKLIVMFLKEWLVIRQ